AVQVRRGKIGSTRRNSESIPTRPNPACPPAAVPQKFLAAEGSGTSITRTTHGTKAKLGCSSSGPLGPEGSSIKSSLYVWAQDSMRDAGDGSYHDRSSSPRTRTVSETTNQHWFSRFASETATGSGRPGRSA